MLRCAAVVILGALGLWILLEMLQQSLNPYGGLTELAIVFGLMAVGLVQIITIVSHYEIKRLQSTE